MTITFSKSAKKSIDKLDSPTKQRIKNAIDRIPDGDIKRLQGYISLYRLRVGNWRIMFSILSQEIYIEDVLPRGSAYK